MRFGSAGTREQLTTRVQIPVDAYEKRFKAKVGKRAGLKADNQTHRDGRAQSQGPSGKVKAICRTGQEAVVQIQPDYPPRAEEEDMQEVRRFPSAGPESFCENGLSDEISGIYVS